jgi:hypothetical protein
LLLKKYAAENVYDFPFATGKESAVGVALESIGTIAFALSLTEQFSRSNVNVPATGRILSLIVPGAALYLFGWPGTTTGVTRQGFAAAWAAAGGAPAGGLTVEILLDAMVEISFVELRPLGL